MGKKQSKLLLDVGDHRELLEEYSRTQHEYEKALLRRAELKRKCWAIYFDKEEGRVLYFKTDMSVLLEADAFLIGAAACIGAKHNQYRWTWSEYYEADSISTKHWAGNPFTDARLSITNADMQTPKVTTDAVGICVILAEVKKGMQLDYILENTSGSLGDKCFWGMKEARYFPVETKRIQKIRKRVVRKTTPTSTPTSTPNSSPRDNI